MGQVIVLASGKGGTGKSTVSVGLAVALAKKEYKVLVVDCDSGMRGVDIMLDVSKDIVFDASDAVSGGCEYKNAVYPTKHFENLDMIPAPFESDDEISPSVFKQLIEKVKADYDYVIIDSPAGVGTGFITAATPADRALIVINAEPTSIRGCLKVRKKLMDLNIEDIRLVINRFNPDEFFNLGTYSDLDEVIDVSQTQLIGLIPDDYRIVSLLQNGKADKSWSAASIVFDCMASRIEGSYVPLAYR